MHIVLARCRHAIATLLLLLLVDGVRAFAFIVSFALVWWSGSALIWGGSATQCSFLPDSILPYLFFLAVGLLACVSLGIGQAALTATLLMGVAGCWATVALLIGQALRTWNSTEVLTPAALSALAFCTTALLIAGPAFRQAMIHQIDLIAGPPNA